MRISFANVPILRGSALQLFAPGWTKGYYSTAGSKPDVQADAKRIVVSHHAERGIDSGATEKYCLVDPNHLEITLEGKLTSDLPAKLEWTLGYLCAFPLYGGEYSGDGAKAMPIVPSPVRHRQLHRYPKRPRGYPLWPAGDDPCHDEGRRRKDEPARWPARAGPALEPGDSVRSGSDVRVGMPVGRPFKYVVSIEYQPAAKRSVALDISANVTLQQVNDAFIPQPRPIQIIPLPKKVKWNDGKFRLKPGFNLDETFRFQKAEWPDPEHYTIHCDNNGILIGASSERGKFYAQKTLEQIVHSDADGSFIPACDIDDWPTMTFRGVHLFPGKDWLDFHRKLIERIFARFKLNSVVLECDFTKWEANPKLWTDISVPKDQLREYAKIVRDNFIEPIPLVQSLGHAEWMFKNGQNRELAEDPRACWAYDATNPATYDFIEKIYDEMIDIFHPKWFHIGHDEVVDRGEYPYREESKKHTVADLFAMDVKKLDGYFRPKGIRMMLWGDMMLTKSESNDGGANAVDEELAFQMRRDSEGCGDLRLALSAGQTGCLQESCGVQGGWFTNDRQHVVQPAEHQFVRRWRTAE